MGNKGSKNNEIKVAKISNLTDDKQQTKQKELGFNYRVTDAYVFFMEGFLHQWYKAPMTIDKFEYNCCEQYMMIEKAKLFNDLESLHKLKKSQNPLDQKLIGRQIKNFDEEIWQKHRFDIVYKGNLAKFQQNKDLKVKLLSYPYSIEFVNANPGDKIWGIGVGVFDPKVTDPNNWNGLNLLGKVMTKVRDWLIPSISNEMIIKNMNIKSLVIASGYVRKMEMKYKCIVPSEIILLLAQFFVLLEDVRFNVFNSENCVAEKDGMFLKTSDTPHLLKCHRLFTSDKGYNNGIVIWKIKFISKYKSREGGIGIMSGYDKDAILNSRPWINDRRLKDLIYWSRIKKCIDSRGMFEQVTMNVDEEWNTGDIIKILLNCQEWYVQFYLNDDLLKDVENEEYDKIMIEKNRKYYPVVAFYEEHDQYEVVVS